MGTRFPIVLLDRRLLLKGDQGTMNRFIVFSALLAVAAAEAEPWYGLYGYGYKPVITSVGALTTYSNGAVTPTNTPAVAAATASHLATKFGAYAPVIHPLGKRSAEAEAEPWYGLYGHGLYGYAGLHPYTAGLGCHNAYGAPVPCAGRKKREAEAEADPYLYYPAYPGVTSVGGLTTYSNGAVVPTALNTQAATAAHLVSTYPRAHGYGVYGLGLWG